MWNWTHAGGASGSGSGSHHHPSSSAYPPPGHHPPPHGHPPHGGPPPPGCPPQPPPPLPPRPPGYELALWQPRPGTTWNYVLQHPLRLDHPQGLDAAHVYILDLFDTPAETVSLLRARGHRVVAYFSAGTREDWRPDAHLLASPPSLLGRSLDDWPGERWLRTGAPQVRAVMAARLDLARARGFDAVDPDNVDAYDNKNGLGLTRDDAVEYVTWLAREARARGLAAGLKNAGDIVPRVLAEVQFAVNEQAVQFGDVDQFLPFVRAGKPVFHVEYPKGEDEDDDRQNDARDVTGRKRDRCFGARAKGFSTIIKNIRLDQWIQTA